jgi:uncharacterized protein (DUF433 family)
VNVSPRRHPSGGASRDGRNVRRVATSGSLSDMHWQDRIAVDPQICHGQACVRGSRVLVSVILDGLADRESPEAVAAAYGIDVEDVRASLAYAAELAKERVFSLRGTPAA